MLVDNSATQAAPIIIESNPTWGNFFGRIERRAFMGAYYSDHTMLKAGSIHHANGGYLVLSIKDLLMNAGVWEEPSGGRHASGICRVSSRILRRDGRGSCFLAHGPTIA